MMMSTRQSRNLPFGLTLYPLRPGQVYEDLPIDRLRDMVRRERLVVLRGFAARRQDSAALARYAACWGDIMMWPFGAVLNIVADEQATDHIFDTGRVPLHWDGMYRETIPEFQLFRCVHAPAENEGGRTIFVDTPSLLDAATPGQIEAWSAVSLTYGIARVSHYGGVVSSPLLVPHPVSGATTMRYNEPVSEGERFLNRHTLEHKGIAASAVDDFQRDLHERIHGENFRYAHHWESGDIVIADNFSLLHGREAFHHRSARHLQRVHIHASPVFENPGLQPRPQPNPTQAHEA